MKLYSDLEKSERIRLAKEYLRTGIKPIPAPSPGFRADIDHAIRER